MKLRQSKLQNVRIGLYVLLGVLLFIAMCIMFALFAQKGGKDGTSDGRNVYFIFLAFLTIPAIVYQVGVPMWSRTQKFSNLYAFVSVDVIFTILWLAAFAAVASWVRAGVTQGAADAKIAYSAANCTTFGYGTEQKCHLGNAATGCGVLLFLIFAGTSAISVLFLMQMRRDPSAAALKPWLAPGELGEGYRPTGGNLEDGRQSKDRIWDTTYAGPDAEPDEDEYAHNNDHGATQHQDDYAPLQDNDGFGAGRPARRWEAPSTAPPVDTGYHGAPGGASHYHAPSAVSPSDEYFGQTDNYGEDYRPPPRYSFTPGEQVSIPDPGEAGRRR